jgi:hypothetical protein
MNTVITKERLQKLLSSLTTFNYRRFKIQHKKDFPDEDELKNGLEKLNMGKLSVDQLGEYIVWISYH